MQSLIDQFIAEEASPHVRDAIGQALKAHTSRTGECRRRFEFNRFELTIDFEKGHALIEDVLQPGADGEQFIELSELVSRLGNDGGA